MADGSEVRGSGERPTPAPRPLLERRWVPLAAVLVLAFVFLLAVYVPTHGAIANVDGVYEAQVARNLISGHGYTTDELPLYAIATASDRGASVAPPWTNSMEFPLPIGIQAGLLAASGDRLFVATTAFSAGFFLASVALAYWIGRSITGRPRPALLAAALVATNPLLVGAGLSGKGDSLDLFLFLLALAALLDLQSGRRAPTRSAALLGVATGLAVLAMFAQGLFMAASFGGVVVWRAAHTPSERGWARVRPPLAFAGLAVAIVGPVLLALSAAGSPVLASGNLGLQLVSYTPAAKFMNGWWKLLYPPQAGNLSAFAHAYAGQVWSKAVVWGTATSVGFAGLGIPYVVLPFTPVSVWWLPVGYLLYRVRRRATEAGSGLRAVAGSVGWLVVANVALSLVFLSPLEGSLEYVEYVIPAVVLLAALGLDEGLAAFGRWLDARRAARGPAATPPPGRRRWTLDALAPTSELRTLGPPLAVAVLVVLPPALAVGLVPGTGAPTSIAPDWYTDQDPAALALVRAITGPGQVVVAAEPWNVAWYDQTPAVGLPEYPDGIESLMGLGLNVSAVYVANLDGRFFQDVGAPYTYDAYVRDALYGYSIAGFTLVHRASTPLGPDLVLERNPAVPLADLLDTREIQFGNASDAGPLLWGWGPDTTVDGTPADWAGVPGGPPPLPAPGAGAYGCGTLAYFDGFCLPAITFGTADAIDNGSWSPSNGSLPEAELTFLVDGPAPTRVTVEVLSPVADQNVALVVNANRVSFGDVGELAGVAPVPVAEQWTNLTFTIPRGSVVPGLNVLDFFFSTGTAGPVGPYGPTTLYAAFHRVGFA